MSDGAVRIPHEQLEPSALRGVVEEFVTRDGTELTDVEPKRLDVMRLLARGEVAVYFDPVTSSCSIRSIDDGVSSSWPEDTELDR